MSTVPDTTHRTTWNRSLIAVLLLSIPATAIWFSDELISHAAATTLFEDKPLNVESTWGIRVLGIRLTAAGYMLDFRYRLLDAQKANALFNRRIKPHLIVEKSGAKLQVPITNKLGPLRQTATHAKVDRNYFTFFANPGRHVDSGDKVTVVIGEIRLKDIAVQ